jgi:predicted permease
VFRRRRPPADFEAEIEAHLQLEVDRLKEAGLSQGDAEKAAQRAFGNLTASRERYYEAGRFLFWDRLVQDVRFALLLLARTPLLTAAIVSTLALGIGATTAVFSLVHAVVLRPLSYEKPDRLVQLWESGTRAGGEADWVSFPNFRDWRRESRAFEDMAAYRFSLVTLTGAEGAESILGLETTDSLFGLLGIRPVLGRTFLPGEDRPGRESVAVISHALWLRRFGKAPKVVGRQVTLDDRTYTIVGVMPATFRFPDTLPTDSPLTVDVWIPTRPSGGLEERGSHNYWAVARLKAGTSLDQARAAMSTIAAALARQYPGTNKDMDVKVALLQDYVAGSVRPALLLLLGAVGLVLLLTCANVANLLLSRAEARRREMAVRHALGASRLRLVCQTLTESLVLSLVGAAAGIALAHLLLLVVLRLGPGNVPRLQQATIDAQVLLFTAAVGICVGIAFGVAPALLGSRGSVQGTLKETGTRTTTSAAGALVRQALVTAQVALAMTLLVGAGLLVRSFAKVARLDTGFHAPRAVTAFVGLSPTRYGDPAKQATFFEDALRSIRGLPGVVSAAASNSIPLTGINDQGDFTVEGWPPPSPGQDGPQANHPRVSAGYFEVMGIPLLGGRLFDGRDVSGSPRVAIVSDVAARTYWPGVNPIGKRLAVDWNEGKPLWHEIVGVVQGTRHFGLEAPRKPEVYIPHTQSPSAYMSLIVRAQGDPAALAPAIRERIAAIDPNQAVFGFQTMDELRSAAGARRRFQTSLVASFAALALLLAAIGVYGVMAHRVAQRHREIGVRLALGARPRDVVAMLLRHGMRLTLAGMTIGLAGAMGLSRALAGLLFGVSALDTATYTGVGALLMFVAGLSAYVASRAAARIDPLSTLREE